VRELLARLAIEEDMVEIATYVEETMGSEIVFVNRTGLEEQLAEAESVTERTDGKLNGTFFVTEFWFDF
jgi:hypothetical protein